MHIGKGNKPAKFEHDRPRWGVMGLSALIAPVLVMLWLAAKRFTHLDTQYTLGWTLVISCPLNCIRPKFEPP